MAYGSSPVGSPAQHPTHRRRAAAASLLLLCAGCAAFLGGGPSPLVTHVHLQTEREAKASETLLTWSAELAEFESAKPLLTRMSSARDEASLNLPGAEKTDQNTCLNKQYAELISAHGDEQARNKLVIGTAFEEKSTGKDDYANARNKVALKDDSYKPVATAAAEAKVLAGFMHANEILEAGKWLEGQDSIEAEGDALKMINLLGPTSAMLESARSYVQTVKADFASLVHHCFITDCPPGKGFEETEGGPKCDGCPAGKWNGETDSEPCADVMATCMAGQGYAASTGKESDATCTDCVSGTFSAADDAEECKAFEVTSCLAGQQLTAGHPSGDGTCNDCAAGTFSRGTTTHSRCVPHTVVTCPAGQQSKEGDSSTDTICEACAAGTFSLGGGAACGPHGSSECGPGFVHVPGSTSSRNSCAACSAGKYKAGTSSSQTCHDLEVTTCPASMELTAGSATSDGTCSKCPSGTNKAAGPGPCTTARTVKIGPDGHPTHWASFGWGAITFECNSLRFGGKVGLEAFIARDLKKGDGYFYAPNAGGGVCRRIPKSGMQDTKNAASTGAWYHSATYVTAGPEL